MPRLLTLIALSTVILRFAYHVPGAHNQLGVLTAAYFTVETVATVGYGDYSFATQDTPMKVFAIALIVVGVALVSTAFALFTNILVSRRIERSLGRRQVPGMADHVVVIGLGAVGIAVVQGLIAEGQRVVVIERDDNNRYLAQARALGVPVVIADATQLQTHRMVNLDDASAVAVLTSADLTNIETGLAIRESLGERWEEVPVVLRVFDRDLARMMEQSFGFRHVRSTSALAAPWFVGAALGLDVLSTFYVDQQPFLVGRVTVAPQGGLQGLAMADLSARTRVIALQPSGRRGQARAPAAAGNPLRRRGRGVPARPVRGASGRAASRPGHQFRASPGRHRLSNVLLPFTRCTTGSNVPVTMAPYRGCVPGGRRTGRRSDGTGAEEVLACRVSRSPDGDPHQRARTDGPLGADDGIRTRDPNLGKVMRPDF